jgi:hypothetical protein
MNQAIPESADLREHDPLTEAAYLTSWLDHTRGVLPVMLDVPARRQSCEPIDHTSDVAFTQNWLVVA